MLCIAALAAVASVAAHAQTAAPTPATAPTAPALTETWQDQQNQQAWATAQIAASPRRHEWVEIVHGGRKLKAFVTYPAGQRRAPAVLVLHEAFGMTDSTLAMADTISAMGYVTVAPDMLSALGPGGGGTSAFPTWRIAGKFISMLPDETVNAMLNAWSDFATRLPGSDGRLAVAGLSWGGGAAFRYAGSGVHRPGLQAVFVFYDVGPPGVTQGPDRFGKTNPPAPVDRMDVPVYGFYPDRDMRVMNSLPATKEAMAAAGKKFEPVVYEGAEHAYMRIGADPADRNPANAVAIKASYARLKALLGALETSK